MSPKEWDIYETMWDSKFRENLLSVIRDCSLSEISKRTGISRSAISTYISGRSIPSAWNCVRLARGLGVPITDIVDYFW